ncbi:MAG TPA: hypothetical protein VGO21_00095 [Candidatus Paceibacterota bacterium]|jgi:hypothetical protein|nr:hypothetical protein [Candidatus Paceibacterota bacterium]
MKKLLIALTISAVMFLMLIVPAFSSAAGLVPCDNKPAMNGNQVAKNPDDGTIRYDNPCDFIALMALVNNVIKFILFELALPIAAVMFFYAGFELVTSGGSTEKRGTAKKVFTNAAIGLCIAAAAWLIIRTLLAILGYHGAWIGF